MAPTEPDLPYRLLADAVLVLHAGVVVFVVAGLFAIVVGNFRYWAWVNSWAFRVAHASAIAIVVAQAWMGAACPLTLLENRLREKAAGESYTGSFIQHWLQQLLYYEAPHWVFLVGYSLFGLMVAVVWWYFPPSPRRRPGAA